MEVGKVSSCNNIKKSQRNGCGLWQLAKYIYWNNLIHGQFLRLVGNGLSDNVVLDLCDGNVR